MEGREGGRGEPVGGRNWRKYRRKGMEGRGGGAEKGVRQGLYIIKFYPLFQNRTTQLHAWDKTNVYEYLRSRLPKDKLYTQSVHP